MSTAIEEILRKNVEAQAETHKRACEHMSRVSQTHFRVLERYMDEFDKIGESMVEGEQKAEEEKPKE